MTLSGPSTSIVIASDDWGECVMTVMRDEAPYRATSRLLITGVVLTVVGGVVGLAGATATVVAAATAARRRMEHMDVPPRELARRQWRRAWTAANAGADAWRTDKAMAGTAASAR